MMHSTRAHSIRDVSTADELADLLADHAWTTCTGFRLGGWLWLNDSTSENGAQEFAVVHEGEGMQHDSWTCSWMTRDRCEELILATVANPSPEWHFGRVQVNLAGPAHRCGACA
jgi:hypothetical protein